nr:FlxA-like family protein [Paenibacillus harenae]
MSELMKQSKQLSEHIESVNQNKNLDDKIRMERVNALKEQIQQIEAQISQIRTEELSKQQRRRMKRKPRSNILLTQRAIWTS